MEEIGYILWRVFGRWLAGIIALLLVVGVGYGLVIGDVKKGVNDVYVRPVQSAFTWMMENKTERIKKRMENVIESAFGTNEPTQNENETK